MRLGSVRALKEELKTRFEPPKAVLETVGFTASSASMRRLAEATHLREPRKVEYSLGVSAGRGRKDYRLGVRVRAPGPIGAAIAARLLRATRNEADVRLVPYVGAGPGRITASVAQRSRYFSQQRRPLEAGASIAHVNVTAGTLGFIVEDRQYYYALSNNHVLANVNDSEPGDLILQPGPADRRPTMSSIVGVLDRFVPISFSRSNLVDCALAQLLPDLEFYQGWNAALSGHVRGHRVVTEDDLGRPVVKAGRTTGETSGVISQVEVDRLRVDMGEPGAPREATFSNQFEVIGDDDRPFSQGGDSGSLIVGTDGYACGLLFAGGPDTQGVELTFANQIEEVLGRLNVKLSI